MFKKRHLVEEYMTVFVRLFNTLVAGLCAWLGTFFLLTEGAAWLIAAFVAIAVVNGIWALVPKDS